MDLRLVPYDQKYDDSIRELEQLVIQGKSIQLEIIKDHFLSRSIVYKKYYPCLAVDEHDTVLAIAIGAKTGIIVNGTFSDAGIGYDVKVHPRYRNKGIGRKMAKFIYKEFFVAQELSKSFITLKAFNIPVIKLVSAVRPIWLYDFVYLTIPVKARVTKSNVTNGKKQLLSITLFHTDPLSPSYYTTFKNGLGYFHTYKMYWLKIRHIHPFLKLGLGIMKKVQPRKYGDLPGEKTVFSFATLYNHNTQNVLYINEVLDELEKSGVNYLMVCCRKKDAIYNVLKEHSISTSSYYILSDFLLKKEDEVSIDVRCL